MKFDFTATSAIKVLPPGFKYISQDNFYIANLNNQDTTPPINYLFSDSATSCIIVIVEGKDKDNNPLVAMAHLSRKERFLAFFEKVSTSFYGKTSVFAQGANPANAPASIENALTLISWVNENKQNKATQQWFIEQVSLSVGQGNPQEDDRGCFGINLSNMTVSNQRFLMTDLERDPSGGSQTLFCVFGLKVEPQVILPEAGSSFTQAQLNLLVAKAHSEQWTDILYMTKDEVLNKYSSTPQYEAPWFFSSLRDSALYVKNFQQ
ncbi:hypothetical protein [Pseudoalteromonas denitrificans]|jgi:hypothetical protein|uniref:Uncharacterized protein n=1 Tax=Pseudoalteromonas denitrificans DSM 6059 TaxID=1123010 RepID=A0A1I1GC72_9GAMM|nr:hypothetical protein [Pseudoalteromonas denitrificans]SFC07468.1 hypothetical protein SAMN02745724_00844 [Pseudoalteromonas denitrificans DSM 6059]